MNNSIVIIYKEVGKEPVFRKVENNIKYLEKILGGKVETIPYEDIVILCRKNRDNLKANVYINNTGFSIKGNIILVKKDDNKFVSLNKGQAIRYGVFLIQHSFDYRHFDKNGKYLSNRDLKRRKQEQIKNNITLNNIPSKQTITNIPKVTIAKQETPINISNNTHKDFTISDTLKLIVDIQYSILAFIQILKDNNNL